MSGAVVTSSGDEHRGFHQTPNVLRDKYAKLIGVDGYGFVNYLISWANSGTALSQRRMMKDLKVSQSKLERVQENVLKHCAPFITMTQGNQSTTNRWHLDMRQLWQENALHMAQMLTEKAASPPVLKPNTPPKGAGGASPLPVSEINTPCIETQYTPVLKPDTFKDITNTSKKSGGVLIPPADPPEPTPAPAGPDPEPPVENTTLQAAPSPDPDPPVTSGEAAPGGAEGPEADEPDELLDRLVGGHDTDVTSSAQVAPGRAIAEALVAEAGEGHDPQATYRVLERGLGGAKKLNAYMEEQPPGIAARGLNRRRWLTEVTPEEASEIVATAQREFKKAQEANLGGVNPWTAISTALDRRIGADIKPGSRGHEPPLGTAGGAAYAPARIPEPAPQEAAEGRFAPGATYRLKVTGIEATLVERASVPGRKGGEVSGWRLSNDALVSDADLATKFEYVGRPA
jgi:hypothetical protein